MNAPFAAAPGADGPFVPLQRQHVCKWPGPGDADPSPSPNFDWDGQPVRLNSDNASVGVDATIRDKHQ